MRLIHRGEAIPPCLDAGWAAPDIAGTLDELTLDEAAELQAWLDRGPRIPNVELWRIDDPVAWPRERLVARCLVPSITTLGR